MKLRMDQRGDSSVLANVLFWLAAFLLPVLLLIAACVMQGVYPFGPESFLTEDLKFQYCDFFTWYKKVLAGEASLWFIPNQTLGNNGWGLFSYYLSSPFNLLIVFFDESSIVDFAFMLTAVKLGFMGVACSFFIRKRFGLSCAWTLALMMSFVWSCWGATQLRNPLWLDLLIALPLAMWGLRQFITSNKRALLIASVTYAIVTCWYTGYMLVIFLCMAFVLEAVAYYRSSKGHNKKPIPFKVISFLLALLTSLLLSMWTFLPTVFAMSGNTSTMPVLDFFGHECAGESALSALFPGGWLLNYAPQLYCGMLLMLLAGIFFTSSKVDCGVKIASAAVLLVSFASTQFSALQFIWCGFRIPNGFYSRTAVFFAFILLWIAAFGLASLFKHKEDSQHAARGVIVTVLFYAFLCCVCASLALDSVILAFTLLLLYACVLHFYLTKRPPHAGKAATTALAVLLVVLVIFDTGYNAQACWKQLYEGYSQEYHQQYVEDSYAQQQELADHDSGTYRIEKTYTRESAAVNEGMATGYLQLSGYSSAHSQKAIDLLSELGYGNTGAAALRYVEPILLSDSLLGVKYVAADEKPAGFSAIDLAKNHNGAKFYANPYALPLAYSVNSSAVDCSLEESSNVFEAQNSWVKAMLGDSTNCYQQLESTQTANSSSEKTWEVTVPEGMIGYAYVTSPNKEAGCILSIDAKTFDENLRLTHSIRTLNNTVAEDETHYTVSLSSMTSEFDTCLFYGIRLSDIAQVTSQLQSHSMIIDEWSDSTIKGTYHADGAGQLLMLTIANDRGWTAKVNGQQVDTLSAINDVFLTLPMQAGDNQIELHYVSPGFYLGCAISLLTLLAPVAILALRKIRKVN